MPCTFETPCGNAKRWITRARGSEQYACVNGHTLWPGSTPPIPMSQSDLVQATRALRKKCGYLGCQQLPKRGWQRCPMHKGRTDKALRIRNAEAALAP